MNSVRAKYREVKTVCGDYLDIDIYPVIQVKGQSTKRGKRFRPTSEVMARYNRRKSELRLEELVLTNFARNGLFFNPTWEDKYLPADEDEAKRFVVNFLRRLKYYRRKNSLPELKYIYKIERGKRSGRLHAHMILNCCDMPVGALDDLWGKGYCYSSRVRCDSGGCLGLSKYFCKGTEKKEDGDQSSNAGYSWVPSRNLEKPKKTSRDGRISKRQAVDICTGAVVHKTVFEKLYPGYELSLSRCLYNEVNGGYYIAARMRRTGQNQGKKVSKCRSR